MAFSWRDYLSLAEDLSKRGGDAAKRSANSRAYYAAYCTARDRYVEEAGPLPLDYSTHATVWSWFSRSRNGIRKFIGRDGRRLGDLRVTADYEIEFTTLDLDLPKALTLARKIIDNLDSL